MLNVRIVPKEEALSAMNISLSRNEGEGVKELKNKREIIIHTYHSINAKIVDEYINEIQLLLNELGSFKESRCYKCRSFLQFVDLRYDNYLSCLSKKCSNQHKYRYDYEQRILKRIRTFKYYVDYRWYIELKEKCNLSKKVKNKLLFNFLKVNGLQDLREKYGYQPTFDSLSGLFRAKERANDLEAEICKILEVIHT